MSDESKKPVGRIIFEFDDHEIFADQVDKVLQGGAVSITVEGDKTTLPPVTDPTDQKILELVSKNPTLTDYAIGMELNISRQAVNERRRKLQAMGYTVR